MRDPLSDPTQDPYTVLGVPPDCTTDEAERAMDELLMREPQKAAEALDACDMIRYPARRLIADLFRYPHRPGDGEPEPPAPEELNRWIEALSKEIDGMTREIKLDRVMPIGPIDELRPPR